MYTQEHTSASLCPSLASGDLVSPGGWNPRLKGHALWEPFSLPNQVSFPSFFPWRIIGHWPSGWGMDQTQLHILGVCRAAWVGICSGACHLAPPGFGRTPFESLSNLMTPDGRGHVWT